MGLSFSLDNVGPLARTAEDCARLLVSSQAMTHVTIPPRCTPSPTTWRRRKANVEGLKIGIPKAYFLDDADDEVLEGLADAQAVFQDLGATLVPVDIVCGHHGSSWWAYLRYRSPRVTSRLDA